MKELRYKLANLREQWEAEKQGVGNVAEIRNRLEQVELRIQPALAPRSSEKQAARPCPSEDDYQQLYELDNERKQALARSSKRMRHDAAPAAHARPPPAAPGSRPGRNRRSRQRLDRHPGHAACWKPSGPSCWCSKSGCTSASSGRTKRSRPWPTPSAAAARGLQDPNRPIGSFIFLGPDRRRQNRALQGAGRSAVRRRKRHGPPRHERVHGTAHRQPA